ncbi:MAG: hypothetical protein A2W26_14140 [Acidobacteria bacterium RBG_16_64_8]|nr:MAG: hypothetical protein A2W26_14140 [Acidobacteria bacterium RBG_16_64_8]
MYRSCPSDRRILASTPLPSGLPSIRMPTIIDSATSTATPAPSDSPLPSPALAATVVPSPTPAATATSNATPTAPPTPGPVEATFVYDGDGNRVLGSVGGITTVYIGDHYEIEGTTIRKYYNAGGQRVAMREDGALYWLLTDHLGSTAVTASEAGAKVGEKRYEDFGETRYAAGESTTTFRYTGQREEPDIGLYFYRARWYDPALGRFEQTDTLVANSGGVVRPGTWTQRIGKYHGPREERRHGETRFLRPRVQGSRRP